MPYNAVLSALIDELNTVGPVAYIEWRKAQAWPDGALETFTGLGLLSTVPEARSVECQGCENRCFMAIVSRSDETGSGRRVFIVCDVPDRQAQMGRMPIPLEQLRQWKISMQQLACVIAGLLGFDQNLSLKPNQTITHLGMMKSDKGRRWISLRIDPLRLEINGYEMPLQDVLYFEGEELQIDRAAIDDRLNRVSLKEGKEYSPSTDRRDAGKLATLAMYQDWCEEYRRLKKANADKPDTWIAKQIAKMPISQGRSEGRIRKMMKY